MLVSAANQLGFFVFFPNLGHFQFIFIRYHIRFQCKYYMGYMYTCKELNKRSMALYSFSIYWGLYNAR